MANPKDWKEFWDELIDTIEAMQKHIEALQQENEQLRKKGRKMKMKKCDFMLSTGPGHYVTANKVLAISGRSPNGHLPAPLTRLIDTAMTNNKVIDHTGGRATNSVIHLEGGYLVLSHIRSETLSKRVGIAKKE